MFSYLKSYTCRHGDENLHSNVDCLVGSAMCQSYLTAMQERWGWLLQVLSCIDAHLKNAQARNLVRFKHLCEIDDAQFVETTPSMLSS